MKFVFLLILLCAKMTYSQNTNSNEEVQRLLVLGRDHIITIALKKLQQEVNSNINIDDFHFIIVKASDQRILVNFGYNVLYLPKNSSYYSDILVELPSKKVSKSVASNDSNNTIFYKPTSEHLKIINFLMNPNETNTDIFHKGVPYSTTTIYEEDKHYLVDFSSRNPYQGGSFSKEEIDKKTRKVISILHGHYAPAPVFPEDTINQKKFIEIKE